MADEYTETARWDHNGLTYTFDRYPRESFGAKPTYRLVGRDNGNVRRVDEQLNPNADPAFGIHFGREDWVAVAAVAPQAVRRIVERVLA